MGDAVASGGVGDAVASGVVDIAPAASDKGVAEIAPTISDTRGKGVFDVAPIGPDTVDKGSCGNNEVFGGFIVETLEPFLSTSPFSLVADETLNCLDASLEFN